LEVVPFYLKSELGLSCFTTHHNLKKKMPPKEVSKSANNGKGKGKAQSQEQASGSGSGSGSKQGSKKAVSAANKTTQVERQQAQV
jgi:hypothetical protein